MEKVNLEEIKSAMQTYLNAEIEMKQLVIQHNLLEFYNSKRKEMLKAFYSKQGLDAEEDCDYAYEVEPSVEENEITFKFSNGWGDDDWGYEHTISFDNLLSDQKEGCVNVWANEQELDNYNTWACNRIRDKYEKEYQWFSNVYRKLDSWEIRPKDLPEDRLAVGMAFDAECANIDSSHINMFSESEEEDD